jgi:hypothetical protein
MSLRQRSPAHFAKLFASTLLSISGLAAQTPADSWKSLRFLMGTWEAKTLGGDVRSSGSYSFEPELRGHVLVRRSATSDCKGPRDYDCEHGDILYIYPEGAGTSHRAIYFDNEGHVIQYTISTPAPGTAVFSSDDRQPGPQFRLVYELKGSVMSGKFQVKAPGQAEFRSYLEWAGEKKQSQ